MITVEPSVDDKCNPKCQDFVVAKYIVGSQVLSIRCHRSSYSKIPGMVGGGEGGRGD